MADVLVIDDDADIRSLLSMALELDGHRVRTAHNGRVGIEVLQGLVADGLRPAVILDVQMPDLDGWEVLEMIRTDSTITTVPVTLCTVKASDADLARGRRLGCDAYQSKPFDISELSELVSELSGLTVDELEARRRHARGRRR